MMDIYLVYSRIKDGFLHIQYSHRVTWVPKETCTVYTDRKEAHSAGMYAFNDDEGSEEKFEIVHLVARNETDSRPLTKDGKPILSGKHYWRTNTHGVERVRVEEISATYYSATERIECYCRLDIDFWSPPECLYSTEPLAWVAWKEEQ